MIPGGAPIVMFLGIAQQRDLQTACGAVIMTSLFYFLKLLPIFARCLKFFPRIVIGTLLLFSIGKPPESLRRDHHRQARHTIICRSGEHRFGRRDDPIHHPFARYLKGLWRQISVMLGLIAGTALATVLGMTHFDGVATGDL